MFPPEIAPIQYVKNEVHMDVYPQVSLLSDTPKTVRSMRTRHRSPGRSMFSSLCSLCQRRLLSPTLSLSSALPFLCMVAIHVSVFWSICLSTQLIPKRTAHDKLPKPPSIEPTFRTAYLEVITVGVRDLKPYGFQVHVGEDLGVRCSYACWAPFCVCVHAWTRMILCLGDIVTDINIMRVCEHTRETRSSIL